jgi:Domain of unknown function (DUF6966)
VIAAPDGEEALYPHCVTPAMPKAMTGMLLKLMELAISKLHDVGDTHWAAWLQNDHDLIAAGDPRGLMHVRDAFGGMGSINEAYPQDDPEIGTHLAAIFRMAGKLLGELSKPA